MDTAFSARAILHGYPAYDGAGAVRCAVCGQPSATDSEQLGQIVSDNFTTWDAVAGDRQGPVCAGCVSLFRDFKFRSTALLTIMPGAPEKIDGAAFRALVDLPPPRPFVVTWPSSRKKHCWLNAGVSDAERLRIGCDDHCIEIDQAIALDGLRHVETLFAAGATKAEVNVGFYRPVVSQRLGMKIERIEAALRPLRARGALQILVWATPREKGVGEGDIVMLNDADMRAAELLARLANGSNRRDADPIGFWGNGFVSRVQRRLASSSLLHFVERLAADIDVRAPDLRRVVEWIEQLPDDQQRALLPVIKTSPRVMVAMAQDKARQMRPGAVRVAPTANSRAEDPQPAELNDNIDGLL